MPFNSTARCVLALALIVLLTAATLVARQSSDRSCPPVTGPAVPGCVHLFGNYA